MSLLDFGDIDENTNLQGYQQYEYQVNSPMNAYNDTEGYAEENVVNSDEEELVGYSSSFRTN